MYRMQLLRMMSDWMEHRTTTNRLTVAILLPPGVFYGQFSVCVADNRCALDTSMTWPLPILNL